MEAHGINFLAVIVAALAYMALGAIWYSPALFGTMWMNNIGKTKEQVTADSTPMNYVWGAITSFLSAYGIARVMLWSGTHSIQQGVMIALVVGVCFVLAAIVVNDAFESRPKSLTLVNVIYHIVGFVIAGVIIGAWA